MSEEKSTGTEAYLSAIADAKANGHGLNIDFNTVPSSVDHAALVKAMSDGLSESDQQALQAAADGGHAVERNFSQITHPDHSMRDSLVNMGTETADMVGMYAGGVGGTAAGALTSPVTGPVGPVAGGIGGAALGYAAAHSAGNMVKDALGMQAPPSSVGDAMHRGMDDLQEGGKIAAAGEALGAGVHAGVSAVKGAYPYIASLIGGLPKPVADKLVNNPDLLSQYKGSEESVSNAVGKLQDGLKQLKQQASDMYGQTLETLGIGGPKTAKDAALKLSGPANLKVMTPDDIGKAFVNMLQDAPGKSDLEKLATAANISKSINANLRFAKAGSNVSPISDDLTPTLNQVKDGVKEFLNQIPGGQMLNQANEQWDAMHKVYDALQPHLADSGEATKWLKNVLSDAGSASNTAKQLLAQVDNTIGAPLSATAQNELAVHMLKQPIGSSLVGKMGLMASLIHPARLISAPITIAAQSPVVQAHALSAASAVGSAVEHDPSMVAPMAEGTAHMIHGLLKKNARAGLPSAKDD